jgi:hypothetical protein
MKTIAKRKPPRPSFHERLKVSGYATTVKRIGKIRIAITAAVLEFKSTNAFLTILLLYQDLLLSERICISLFLPNKCHGLGLTHR